MYKQTNKLTEAGDYVTWVTTVVNMISEWCCSVNTNDYDNH